MRASEPYERLQSARRSAGYETAADAARAFGWNVITYRAHENGTRGLKRDAAERYGRAFHVSPAWLLTGEGRSDRRLAVPVMGWIGAAAEIEPEYEQVPEDGLFEVELPFAAPEDVVGFEVLGRAMWPRYDPGDIIVCSRESRSPDSVLNLVAAVRTTDGRRCLKRILPGARPGTYDLESFNAETIRGVQLAWIGEILATVPANRVKASGREPKAAARQTVKAAGWNPGRRPAAADPGSGSSSP